MSDNLALEKAGLYEMFHEAAKDVEIEIDSEEIWFTEVEDEEEVEHTIRNILDLHRAGYVETDFGTIKLIAAIAFCNAADIEGLDYSGFGGECRL